MIYTNIKKNLKLSINKKLIDKLGNMALKKYPNEYGGFLIGKYSSDFRTVFVKDFILPKNYNGTPTKFYRSTDNIEKSFGDIFDSKGLYYIGEWHSHPMGTSMFSQTDLEAMKEIAYCDTVKIENPILLIISIQNGKLDNYKFYLYDKHKLIEYE